MCNSYVFSLCRKKSQVWRHVFRERERERAIGNVLPVYLPAWVSCSHAGCTQGLPIASWITTWASVSVCSGEPWCRCKCSDTHGHIFTQPSRWGLEDHHSLLRWHLLRGELFWQCEVCDVQRFHEMFWLSSAADRIDKTELMTCAT